MRFCTIQVLIMPRNEADPRRPRFPIKKPPLVRIIDYAVSREKARPVNIEVLDNLEEIDCALGERAQGAPPELQPFLEAVVKSGRMFEGYGRYTRDSYSKRVQELLRERNKLSPDEFVGLTAGGSNNGLRAIIGGVPNAGLRDLKFVTIGPHFSNTSKFIARTGAPHFNITPPLDVPYDDKLLLLEEFLEQHRYGSAIFHKQREPQKVRPRNKRTGVQRQFGLVSGTHNNEQVIYSRRPNQFCVLFEDGNNPTGQTASLKAQRRTIELCARRGYPVIIDGAYADLKPDDESNIPLVAEYPNLIVVRGVSKGIGIPGASVGAVFGSKELRESLEEIVEPLEIGEPSQMVVAEMLKPEILGSNIEKTRAHTREVKQMLTEGLRQVGLQIVTTDPDVPIFLGKLPFIPPGRPSLYELNVRYRIIVERGSDFAGTYGENLDDSYVRYRIPESVEKVQEVIRRTEAGISELYSFKSSGTMRPRLGS